MMKFAMLFFAVLLTSFGVVDTIQASQAANTNQDNLVACRRSKDGQPAEQDKDRSRA
ncbi:hypothetical protein [Anabaena azotica]|uniref:Uncharacterized protein n=1 Tax=Anabaena azotica FACHB-119 TaxID=947527 RepID=A0ABR8D2M8_9NOST|nr:hypothetical protein [Anabaena azotica]MBD2501196.1 hypothetical protein [Anabaena azotica FACHB-119]